MKLRLNNLILFILISVLVIFLYTYNLGERSLFPDEVVNARLKSEKINKITYKFSPLYILSLHFWPNFSSVEFSLRSHSVVFGILSLFIIYLLIQYLFNSKIAILTTFLVSISPYFIFLIRQGINSSMSLSFSLLSLYLYFKLLKENKIIIWLSYFIITILGKFVNEVVIYLVFFENLYLYINYKKYKNIIKPWIILNISLLSLFLIINKFLMPQRIIWLMRNLIFGKDYYNFLPFGVAEKILYLFYLFSLGETVMPWSWFITIPAFLIFLILSVFGLIQLKEQKEKLLFFIIFLILPIFTLNLLKNFYPRYFLPLLPLYYAFLVYGIDKIKFVSVKIITFIFIIFIFAYSLFNYCTGKEFHNNTYLDPCREVTNYIIQNSNPADLIIFTRLSLPFFHYFGRARPSNLTHFIAFIKENKPINNPKLLINQIKNGYKRIWFVENSPGWFLPEGMDGKMIKLSSDKLKIYLDKNFKFIEYKKYGYDKYANIKRKFINKVFVDYRIVTSLYEINN